MRPLAHLNLGVFTGLIAQYYFGWKIGIVVFLFQLIPLIDIYVGMFIRVEPLHNIFAVVILSGLVALYDFFAAWIAFVSYVLHIGVDLLVDEGIELFYPFTKKKFKYPVWHSEDIVIAISALGIAVFVVLFYLQGKI